MRPMPLGRRNHGKDQSGSCRACRGLRVSRRPLAAGKGDKSHAGLEELVSTGQSSSGTFEFLQEAPVGDAIGPSAPFKVLNAFECRDKEKVAVCKLVDGKPVIETISVRKASPVAADAFSQLWPPNAPEHLPPSFAAAKDLASNRLQVLVLTVQLEIDLSFVNGRPIVMHHLNTSANLSPTEFASLRHVANGLINTVPNDHRNLLIAMRLACFDGRRGLVLTDLGWRQARARRSRNVASRYRH